MVHNFQSHVPSRTGSDLDAFLSTCEDSELRLNLPGRTPAESDHAMKLRPSFEYDEEHGRHMVQEYSTDDSGDDVANSRRSVGGKSVAKSSARKTVGGKGPATSQGDDDVVVEISDEVASDVDDEDEDDEEELEVGGALAQAAAS